MITDFGLSKLAGNDHVLRTTCGSPIYVAPEVLFKTPGHGRPVDMWAIGVITYILLSGYTPFWGESQADLFEAIKTCDYEFAKHFIQQLLNPNPNNRPTATEALKHEWLDTQHTVDLMPSVRKNFNGKKQFRKAANTILMAGRLALAKEKLHPKHRISGGVVDVVDEI
ncbi:UNVERIFIED_CONTAM: hypothetical protein HDU68_003849 [Siphonaria sp. JEL0065]|nr:hypothetical protein HDU68_003849 [Siphonaria sp. JEL0065]